MAEEHNLAQRFEQRVAEGIDAATPDHVETDHAPSSQERVEQQQAESQAAWAGPGLAALTPGQAIGLGLGIVIGGLIGAILFLPVGFMSIGGLGLGWRLLITASIGAVAGGTAGAVYWGGRAPELTGEMADEPPR